MKGSWDVRCRSGATVALRAEPVPVSDYLEAVELFFERGWTDGLPVVPPTEAQIRAMLAACDRDPQEVLGEVLPARGVATIEKLAINSVMAGCKPDYFPVVIAAMDALLDDRHNLGGVQTTTHGCVSLLIVNGPAVQRLQMNAAEGVFGSGYRANGTIGRAVRLSLWNLGGNYPWTVDKATHSHPGDWSYCIAEWEEKSPWEPFHVERGFRPEESTVTAFACDAPHAILAGGTGPQVIGLVAEAMSALGPNNAYFMGETLVVFSPINARRLAELGWNKHDVKTYLWEHARVSQRKVKQLSISYERALLAWPRWVDRSDEQALVPIVRSPENIHILVAGGESGRFISLCPGWGDMGGFAVTRKVRFPDKPD